MVNFSLDTIVLIMDGSAISCTWWLQMKMENRAADMLRRRNEAYPSPTNGVTRVNLCFSNIRKCSHLYHMFMRFLLSKKQIIYWTRVLKHSSFKCESQIGSQQCTDLRTKLDSVSGHKFWIRPKGRKFNIFHITISDFNWFLKGNNRLMQNSFSHMT